MILNSVKNTRSFRKNLCFSCLLKITVFCILGFLLTITNLHAQSIKNCKGIITNSGCDTKSSKTPKITRYKKWGSDVKVVGSKKVPIILKKTNKDLKIKPKGSKKNKASGNIKLVNDAISVIRKYANPEIFDSVKQGLDINKNTSN